MDNHCKQSSDFRDETVSARHNCHSEIKLQKIILMLTFFRLIPADRIQKSFAMFTSDCK